MRANTSIEAEPLRCSIETDQGTLSSFDIYSKLSFYSALAGLGIAQISPNLLHAVGITEPSTVSYTKQVIEYSAGIVGTINLYTENYALLLRNHLTRLITRKALKQANTND